MDGYETAFDYQRDGTELLYLRSVTSRYADFHSKNEATRSNSASVPDHFADQELADYHEEQKYVAVTANDRKLGLEVYNGLRHSQEDFQYLETDPSILRVQSNGNFELYLVDVDNQAVQESNNRMSDTRGSRN